MSCGELHKEVVKRLDGHDEKFEKQDERICKVESDGSVFSTKIDNLCDNIKSLVSTLKWVIACIIVPIVIAMVGYIMAKK